jgi:serralysin
MHLKRHAWIAIGLSVVTLLAVAAILLSRRHAALIPVEQTAPLPGFVAHSASPEAENKIVVSGRPGQRILGTPGDDKLIDKTGGSVLIGLGGNDTYQAPDERTRIVEQPGQGIDTVETWNNFQLPPNVENLVLVGKYATGTAAPGGSMLTSKGLGNVLESGPGSDTMVADPKAKQTTFLFHLHSGFDAIFNFKAAGEPHDYIRLTYPGLCDFAAIKAKLSLSGTDDTLLTLTPRDKIWIKGVRPETLGPDDFLTCFAPDHMQLVFEDQFDSLSLYDRERHVGRWKTAYTHAPADGPKSDDARRLAGNKDEQIYVDPAYAGDPSVSKSPLGLNPFSTQGGILSIRAWRLPPAVSAKLWNTRFASGLLTTEPSFAQTYGYFEMRAEFPQIKGTFPAFWLLPTSRKWPPEIDIAENVGQDFVTCGMVPAPKVNTAFFIRFHGGVTGMHRYGVLWTPQHILWVFDGEEVGAPRPDFQSAEMKVDYGRAYRWGPPK